MLKSQFARAGVLTIAFGLAASAAPAAPVSPLASLAGSWSGGGTLSTSDGSQEQLRCRASYDVAGAGTGVRINLRCASASYNFDLASEVAYNGGAISGSWTESSRNASGTISG